MAYFDTISIKSRVVSAIVLVTLAVAAFMFVVYFVIGYNEIKHASQDDARRESTIISEYARRMLLNNRLSDIKDIVGSMHNERLSYCAIYDANKQIIIEKKANANEQLNLFQPTGTALSKQYEGYIHILTPIQENETILGWSYIVNQPRSIGSFIWFSLVLFVGLLLVVFAFALLYSRILQRHISNPISFLSTQLEALYESQDFSLRIERQGEGEIATLYNNFNRLVSQIEKQQFEITESSNKIKDSELRFRSLTDLLPQAVFETDRDGRFTFLNQRAKDSFHISNEMLSSGIGIQQVFLTKENRRLSIFDFNKEDISSIQVVGRRTDGFGFDATLYFNFIEKDAAIIGVRGIIVDMTERVAFENQLKKAIKRAEEADNLKSAFLANMSHEIRTPMNAIIGFTDMLAEDSLPKSEQLEYIQYINNSGKLLLNLIDDIIDIAKIEAGQLQLQPREFDVHAVLKELCQIIENEKKRSNKNTLSINFPKHINSQNIFIKSDPYRFRQICINILFNALKFTDTGSITFNYEIMGNKGRQFIHFTIQDTGIGIPPEKLEIIFDRFVKVANTRERYYSGTGLGLAITKHLIELLGGTIWVESSVGVGTTFHFTIPYVQIVQSEEETQTAPASAQNIDWSNKTILIAEDEELNFAFLKSALQRTGAKIIWVQSGAEALNIIKTNKDIDIVLMDIKMPEMNGIDATKAIRELTDQVPIIAQTAYAMAGEKERCIEAGCNDYLSKPIRPHDLINTLQKRLQ